MAADHPDQFLKKEWYLEYRGHRIGPLKMKNIVKGVQRGDLSSKVMISRDQDKWVPIKESPEFLTAVVQILSVKLDSEEDWKRVRPADFVEGSISINRFQAFTDYDAMLSGVDKQLSEAMSDRRKVRLQRDDGIDRSNSIFTNFSTDSGEAAKYEKPKVAQREIASIDWEKRKKEKALRWLTGTLAVVVVAFIGTKFVDHYIETSKLKKAQLLGKQAQQLSLEGNFEKALANLQNAKELDPSNPSLKIDLAKVLVRTNQSNEAQAVLKEVLVEPTAERYFSEAFGLIGLVAIERSDLDFADRQLDLALKQEPSSPQWLHNLAVIRSERGKWEEAEDLYLRAIVAGSDDPATYFGAAEATLLGTESSRRTKNLSTVDRLVSSIMSKTPSYRRQFLAIRARLALAQDNVTQAENLAEALLNVDPYLDEKLDLDVRYSRIRMNMAKLGAHCREVDAGLQRTKTLTAALGLCLAWSGDHGAALTYSNLGSRNPASDEQHSLSAAEATIRWTAAVPGAEEELEGSAETSGYLTPMIIAANLCEKKKKADCATRIWTRILDLDPKNPAALVAVGRSFILKKEPHRAKVYITKAKDIESRYFPVRNALNELLNFSVAL